MPPDTRFRVKPTFPLDETLIRKHRLRRIWRSPLTWGTMAATAALAFATRGVGAAAVTGTGFGGLFAYWRSRQPQLDVDAVQAIINESNRQQDAELKRIMKVLESDGHPQYALSLGKFLLLKQHIETSLHADGELTKQKEEMEVLVDALCRQVCSQITQLTQHNANLGDALTSSSSAPLDGLQKAVDESHERIQKAYRVMYQTAENLDKILQPGGQSQSEAAAEVEVMDRLIEQLQEENEVAQRVHDRLKDVQT